MLLLNMSHSCGLCSASLHFLWMFVFGCGSKIQWNSHKKSQKIHYIDYIECIGSDNLHENFVKTWVFSFDPVVMVDVQHSQRHYVNMQMLRQQRKKNWNCLGLHETQRARNAIKNYYNDAVAIRHACIRVPDVGILVLWFSSSDY